MEFTEKQLEKLVEDVKGQLSQLLKAEEAAPIAEPLEKSDGKAVVAAAMKRGRPAGDSAGALKAEESESSTSTAAKAEESSSSTAKKAEESSVSKEETSAKKAEDSSACKAEESSSAKKAEESSSSSTAEKAESSSMSKAEEELVVVKAENETLKKSVDQLIASLEKVIVKGPDRKSVAGIGEVVLPPTGGMTETLTEPVLKSRLNDLTRSDKLSKAERETINDYCLFGKGRSDVLSIVKEKSK